MSKGQIENQPDAKQLAGVLQIFKAGTYNLQNSEDFTILRIGERKLAMKNDPINTFLKLHDEISKIHITRTLM